MRIRWRLPAPTRIRGAKFRFPRRPAQKSVGHIRGWGVIRPNGLEGALSANLVISLHRKVGRRRYGRGLAATDTKLRREVGVKFLSCRFCRRYGPNVPFRAQAQMQASLNHPNTATIYGIDCARARDGAGGGRGPEGSGAARYSAGLCAPDSPGAGSDAREGHRASRSEA
jgi:hypothetical protein